MSCSKPPYRKDTAAVRVSWAFAIPKRSTQKVVSRAHSAFVERSARGTTRRSKQTVSLFSLSSTYNEKTRACRIKLQWVKSSRSQVQPTLFCLGNYPVSAVSRSFILHAPASAGQCVLNRCYWNAILKAIPNITICLDCITLNGFSPTRDVSFTSR